MINVSHAFVVHEDCENTDCHSCVRRGFGGAWLFRKEIAYIALCGNPDNISACTCILVLAARNWMRANEDFSVMRI